MTQRPSPVLFEHLHVGSQVFVATCVGAHPVLSVFVEVEYGVCAGSRLLMFPVGTLVRRQADPQCSQARGDEPARMHFKASDDGMTAK